MKKQLKRIRKQILALFLVLSMIFSLEVPVKAGTVDFFWEASINIDDGQTVWQYVEFGNYWQSQYTPIDNTGEKQDGEIYTDSDGTEYIVRDSKCYRKEPIKWRVLEYVNSSYVVLIADKNLDVMPYNTTEDDSIDWENSSIRQWLNTDFANTAFTEEQREYFMETASEGDAADASVADDKVFLPSRQELMTENYGFVNDTNETRTRAAANTDFVSAGGTAKSDTITSDGNYWLRTPKDFVGGDGIICGNSGVSTLDKAVRPMIRMYASINYCSSEAVKEDGTVIPYPDDLTPSELFIPQEDKTLPGNPAKDENGVSTWDCIYFGKYYNSRCVPDWMSNIESDKSSICVSSNDFEYIARRNQGYFSYEPIKWRVLSINEDGTDAFLMADTNLDFMSYHNTKEDVTWENSDLRKWLNENFLEIAFGYEEQESIRETEVVNKANPWSAVEGGANTIDKVYLLSIDEAMTAAYGFSTDNQASVTRACKNTDYISAGGTKKELDFTKITNSYWLRSPGYTQDTAAYVTQWVEDGKIPSEKSAVDQDDDATTGLAIRPVLHVDLTQYESVWNYAGKVSEKGAVKEEEAVVTPVPQQTASAPASTISPTSSPVVTMAPQPEQKVQAPGKPVIKKLKNKAGKKVTVTLSKKVEGASGYQIMYATNKKWKSAKKKSFKGTSTVIKGLKKKKTYYFRVCAYTKKNGSTVYGKWSKVKSVKVKK